VAGTGVVTSLSIATPPTDLPPPEAEPQMELEPAAPAPRQIETPLPGRPAPAPRGGQTFPYDGGPQAPVPMPGRAPAPTAEPPAAPRPMVPLEGRSVSLPAKPRYTYAAYGEQPAAKCHPELITNGLPALAGRPFLFDRELSAYRSGCIWRLKMSGSNGSAGVVRGPGVAAGVAGSTGLAGGGF
jgi:hypothetical protein